MTAARDMTRAPEVFRRTFYADGKPFEFRITIDRFVKLERELMRLAEKAQRRKRASSAGGVIVVERIEAPQELRGPVPPSSAVRE